MTRAMAIITTLACLLATQAGDSAAQTGGDPEAHRAAMQGLAFLIGEWEGDGWIAGRDGRRQIRQSEVVRFELGGTILLIEGTARERDGNEIGEVIFNAFAIVSWNPDRGYTMRSYLWNGLEGERDLEVGDGEFSWQQEAPSGTIAYSMRLTEEGDWHETGTLARADGQELPVIEFRLSRTISER